MPRVPYTVDAQVDVYIDANPVACTRCVDLRSVYLQVYELINARWIDQGTAFCFGHYDENTGDALLVARAEASYSEVILQTAIRSSDVYQRQQGTFFLHTPAEVSDTHAASIDPDTLIVWTEPDGQDYALSFQDPEGCQEVWSFILEVQRIHSTAAGA